MFLCSALKIGKTMLKCMPCSKKFKSIQLKISVQSYDQKCTNLIKFQWNIIDIIYTDCVKIFDLIFMFQPITEFRTSFNLK